MEQFIINLNYIKDDITIGYVEICSNTEYFTDCIWISNLYVTDSYRHNGIGSKLLNRAIDMCKKLSITKLYLYCKPKLIFFLQEIWGKRRTSKY
jgi:GNAT superfamily N-acetyltransferase